MAPFPPVILASWEAEHRFQDLRRHYRRRGWDERLAIFAAAGLVIPPEWLHKGTRAPDWAFGIEEKPAAEQKPRSEDREKTGDGNPKSKKRQWAFRHRPIAWVDLTTGRGIEEGGVEFRVPRRPGAAELLGALPGGVERVYLIGDYPATEISAVRAWAMGPGVIASARGHYLESSRSPVLRFRRGERSEVEILRASEWFGAEPVTPVSARETWKIVASAVSSHFRGAGLLATPGQTGRDLWARSIPEGVEFPTLPADVAGVIRSSAGQGRIETCPAVDDLDGLVELDGRIMYGALCWGLGAGPVEHDERPVYEPFRRGRYRARVRVPAEWSHVGLLPVKTSLTGWEFPAERGAEFEGWFDAAEIHLAQKWGWRLEIVERLLLTDDKAKPLDGWAKKLTELALEYDARGWRAARSMVRAILLHGIGAFAGRPRRATRSVAVEDAELVPAGVGDVQHSDGRLYWSEVMPDAGGEWSHPEWSAAVWGRARCRLLDGPGDVGALHVPREAVVGFRTDALYLTFDPGWADDGKAGRFRVKAYVPGPLRAPRNGAELLSLRAAQEVAA